MIMWDEDAINDNIVTLNKPWKGGYYPAGTKVANGSYGGVYMYYAIRGIQNDGEWHTIKVTRSGGEGLPNGVDDKSFRNGTSYVKLMMLPNYDATSTDIGYFSIIGVRSDWN